MPGTVDRVMRFEWPGSTGEVNPELRRTFIWDAALIQRALTDVIWRIAENGITRDCLAAGCVSESKLATALVRELDLSVADGAILQKKLAEGLLTADATGRSKMADGFLTGAKLGDGSVTLAKMEATLAATAYTLPTGSIAYYGGEVCPSGWLECNGAEYLIETYQALYWVCRELWGTPSTGTKFKVPDRRGWVARGWDHAAGNDPNAGTRVRPSGAQGDYVGTTQGDDVKTHTHTLKTNVNMPLTGGGSALSYRSTTTNAGSTTSTSTGGLETTPKNKALMAIIKT